MIDPKHAVSLIFPILCPGLFNSAMMADRDVAKKTLFKTQSIH